MAEYAELHAHSNFSFLDGASHPEELAVEAARLQLAGLALTDHDGLYGVVHFAEAARQVGLRTIFGAELSLGLQRKQNGIPDPEGHHLVVLARSPAGYAQLSRVISEGQLAGKSKGKPSFTLEAIASAAKGQFLILTGCRKGSVPSALVAEGPMAAGRALDELIDAFGQENVAVELWDRNAPLDSARNDALAKLAVTRGVDFIATGNVHYATPSGHSLATALAAIRARRSLDEFDGWLPSSPGAYLRSGAEQLRRFARYPGAVERTGEIASEIAFDLQLVVPGLPPYPTPRGNSEMEFLRELTEIGATKRYGTRDSEQVSGAWRQIDHELSVIDQLGFPGYFLIVWDIVEFCRRHEIFCQGRGSAANSAVCFALGVTNADAVRLGLLFERFLSSARDGPPDIDVDIESGRREEVIQYVYERYGRHHAAQVANVITYRPRSALRDAAKALGHAPGEVDAWSKRVERHGRVGDLATETDHHGNLVHAIPKQVLDLAAQLERFPRHLGVHSGGMVLCNRPVIEVCPVEWATKPGRTVLQWDKDDCAVVGLVKFDLLGLGMLEALHRCIDLITDYYGETIDLATIPQEDVVYAMLCEADTIGVFQVESRAQMGTLPRLKPRTFYDLVVEVALIRPGPIQGGSVHPYLRRRNNEEAITYLHPLLERSLTKTLGVPIFQEQLMQIAIDVAGFSASEADQLRQAMGSKRSNERMERLRSRFYAGMAERNITGQVADEIFSKMAAFANFGFPESHAVSFAYIVYSSAYLKLHYPAAFCAALLNSQPMGFWSPETLTKDAKRHGVDVLRPEVNFSGVGATLERSDNGGSDPVIRLGLASIRSIGEPAAQRIVGAQPYRDIEDLTRRAGLNKVQLEALAMGGALVELENRGRRAALWAVGAHAEIGGPGRIEGLVVGAEPPENLKTMTETEEVVADLRATGVSIGTSLTELVRPNLIARGVVTAKQLRSVADGERVSVAGVVTHRQRPETALGVTFINIEDETGLVNIVVSVGCWKHYRHVAQQASAMVIRGKVEAKDGVVNVVADKIEELVLAASPRSRDFS
jgi:error-prone DNA polymerase